MTTQLAVGHAQSVVYQEFPSGRGSVLLRSGNTLIVGGAGPMSRPLGAGVVFDTTRRALEPGLPLIDGVVRTVAPDGAGGWYVGGDIRAVGGLPRRNLAHILADHTVGAWAPEADSTVFSLVFAQDAVYVGGDFAQVGGGSRRRLARLDATTGQAADWSPDPDSTVRKLVLDSGILFVVGDFASVGGVPRAGLAAIDLSTGETTAWDPAPDGRVTGIDPAGALVYVCGSFQNVGGQARSHVACLDAGSGQATSWAPSMSGDFSGIAVSDTSAYCIVSPPFFFLKLVEFDRETAAVVRQTSFFANSDFEEFPVVVDQMEVSGGTLRFAGTLAAQGTNVSGGGSFHWSFVTVDLASGRLADWELGMEARVHAFAFAGDRLFVGGVRNLVTSDVQDLGHLAAIDIPSGSGRGPIVKVWGDRYFDFFGNLQYHPGLIRALVLSGDTLFLGGRFTRIEDSHGTVRLRHSLAAVDMSTGVLLPWDPNPTGPRDFGGDSGSIASMALRNGQVLVGGRFDHIGGQARNCLAALDAATGAASEWNPAPDDSVDCILSRGDVVYVAGNFSRIGGMPRSGLAALDATARDSTDGITTAWDPEPRPRPTQGWINEYGQITGSRFAPVGTMAFHGPNLIVGGGFTRMGGDLGPLRAGLAELDTTTGAPTAWAPSVSGPVAKVVVDGPAAYLLGDFQQVGGLPRNGVAAVSLETGLPDPWDPNDRPVDPSPFHRRLDLLVEGGTAFVVGTFEDFGPYPHTGLAAMRDVGTPAAPGLESATQSPGRVELVWHAEDGRRRQAMVYRRIGAGDWEPRGFIRTGEDDRLRFEDRALVAGESHGYRLGVARPGAEEFFGETSLTVPGPVGLRFALGNPSPNPARSVIVAEFVLPDARPARLDLVDVAGRLIASRSVGALGPGTHSVNLTSGMRVSPGLYFVSLERDGEQLVRRVALLR